MKFLLTICLLGLAEISLAEDVSYQNVQVFKLTLNNVEKVWEEISKFVEEDERFIIDTGEWRNNSLRVTVPPEMKSRFNDFLQKYNVKYEVEIDNLQSVIDEERQRISQKKSRRFDWSDYHPLSEIYAWLFDLQRRYGHVKVVKGGRTYEGRDIKGIAITNRPGLPGVVIEAGIHAREWISPAGSSWVVNEMLRSREPIWKRFNYLYFPVYNPDGYAYTWTKNNRLWRKTRTVYTKGSKICHGADPNRNWDSHWSVVGTSSDPCSIIYSGPHPFSEIETKTLSEYLTKQVKLRNNKIYISYHSYGQKLLFPYGHTNQHAPLHATWQQIGESAGRAYTRVHGSQIQVGPIYSTVYPVSGDSATWYYEKLNASLSFSYEMRDKGYHGFILPPSQIIPAGQEHYASLKALLEEYLKHFKQP